MLNAVIINLLQYLSMTYKARFLSVGFYKLNSRHGKSGLM